MRTDSWTDVPSVFEGLSSSQQLLAPAASMSGREDILDHLAYQKHSKTHSFVGVKTISWSSFKKKKTYVRKIRTISW